MTRNNASARQVQAADPAFSTWLSANAGSGKTRVLTDRVARLLLDGVDPQHVLCLTYTKAAASEMQNRLFKRLGEWAMLDDGLLRKALADLGVVGRVPLPRLARARQLFARAIETPGGLRIQTIHSFCATLLRRFPLEAGVSPQFTEMDDRAGRLLRDQIADELAETVAPEAMTDLARAYTGESIASLMAQVAGSRGAFDPPLSSAEARVAFGLDEDETEATVIGTVFLGGEGALLRDAAVVMDTGTTTDLKDARRLRAIKTDAPDIAALRALEDVFLFGEKTASPFGAKIGKVPTAATQKRMPHLLPALDALMLRVEAARPRRMALAAAERTSVLHAFAAVFLPVYARRKASRGWLDFDDLIQRAKALMTDPEVAAWVLYRLDGGIDHILVDEAQDTAPDQWRVIELLTAEFTAGQGAQDQPRTLFVVGDRKQSIYSFQGADVRAFDEKREAFRARMADVEAPFQSLELEYSFRSAPAILRLVDLTFDERVRAGVGGALHHIAFKAAMPGRVDLWPVVEKAEKQPEDDWTDPKDRINDTHHAARLGRKVAETIRDLIEAGTQIPVDAGAQAVLDPSTRTPPGIAFRPLHAGDFLILVQRRGDVFTEVIRSCKALGLPIAGADRLKLGAELAVKDLTALLAFLATPEDDLSLAVVLRSPLCGWSEDDLYRLAQPRAGYLWEDLRHRAEAHPETLAMLNDLRDQADFLRPYDLIERALTRHRGRQRLLARLGDEAEDGIDAMLAQAMAYERTDVPSLTGFLIWLASDDVEVKRQADSAGARIRVMTVHGAKGLEAPVVILPETADRRPREHDEIYAVEEGPVVWKMPANASPPLIAEERRARAVREAEESLRLLYVAMTRAQSWLIVAAAGEAASDGAWYGLVERGMIAAGADVLEGGGMRLADGDWPPPAPGHAASAIPEALPDWALHPAPDAPHAPLPLSPSDLGGAKVVPGDPAPPDGTDARERGRLLHLLLEHLPSRDAALWPALAAALIADPVQSAALLAEATGVLTSPDLSRLFRPGALVEVTLTAPLADRRLLGTIDRLIVGANHVLAVDFKSNARVPATPAEVPEGYLRQMAAYAAALAAIYPGRRIETALLWTATASLMPLPPEALQEALARAVAALADPPSLPPP